MEKRFIVDSMLGKLAKWLRVLGFDANYQSVQSRDQLDAFADCGYRVLTRNHRWAQHTATIWVNSNDPAEQLKEVLTTLEITSDEIHLLTRCLRCNALLEPTTRQQVVGRVPDYVFDNCSDFHQCPKCRRIYWAGSHPARMDQWLHTTLGWSPTSEHQGGLS